jgi:hypothetical protein
VQGFADRHEEKEFYAALKEAYGLIHSATVPLKSSDESFWGISYPMNRNTGKMEAALQ